MKKFYLVFISFFSFTFFIGCSDTESTIAKENIEKALTTQFTSADEELLSLWEENSIIIRDGIKNNIPDTTNKSELDTYLTNIYQQYFTDGALDSFISNDSLLYQITAATSGYHMSVDSTTITRTDSKQPSYQISVVVDYQKDNEPPNSATVTGFVSVDKQGKITRINILDDDNLYATFITSQ